MAFLVGTRIDYVRYCRPTQLLSAAAVLISLLCILLRGLNYGVDFSGGTLIELGYPQNADLPAIRTALTDSGYKDAVVQSFGTAKEVLIRVASSPGEGKEKLSNELLAVLSRAAGSPLDMRRVEFVGPQVGKELREEGGLAMLLALAAIFIYVMLRFEWKFSFGAVIALFHDVIITVGFFSIFWFEFDLTVLAAILALIGYSLNDTIVVFDRIRENFRMMRRAAPEEVVNNSINQTLSRTIMTSATTFLVVLALFLTGGDLIRNFALAMLIGIIVGTYSSIFIASNVVLQLGINTQDLTRSAAKDADDTRP